MTKLMTVLVCGGRDYTDYARMKKLLDFNRAKIAMIVHGGAKGADTLAGNWCYERGVPMMLVPAEWARFGKKAGFIRNEKMLSLGKPDLVVAFPGGVGTAMMVRLAKQAGIRVLDVAEVDRHEKVAAEIDDAVEAQRDRLNHCIEDRPKTVADDGCVLELEADPATQQALDLHDHCPI